jgi:hypothetical protein
MHRDGQNRIYTPYMTVYLVISLPGEPYIHRIYLWFWPTLHMHELYQDRGLRLGSPVLLPKRPAQSA